MDQASSVQTAADDIGGLPDRARRRAVEFPAHLVLADGMVLDVRVLDLSYDGCRIEVTQTLLAAGPSRPRSAGARTDLPVSDSPTTEQAGRRSLARASVAPPEWRRSFAASGA